MDNVKIGTFVADVKIIVLLDAKRNLKTNLFGISSSWKRALEVDSNLNASCWMLRKTTGRRSKHKILEMIFTKIKSRFGIEKATVLNVHPNFSQRKKNIRPNDRTPDIIIESRRKPRKNLLLNTFQIAINDFFCVLIIIKKKKKKNTKA